MRLYVRDSGYAAVWRLLFRFGRCGRIERAQAVTADYGVLLADGADGDWTIPLTQHGFGDAQADPHLPSQIALLTAGRWARVRAVARLASGWNAMEMSLPRWQKNNTEYTE